MKKQICFGRQVLGWVLCRKQGQRMEVPWAEWVLLLARLQQGLSCC